MGLRGSGVLAIWNGITTEAEEEFLAWHVREHMPERVGLPGFARGRRYVAVDGTPKYFNFYEAEDAAVFSSEVYRARLDDPSDWTRAVVADFNDTIRTVCDVAFSEGAGGGGFVEAVRLSIAGVPEDFVAALAARARDALETPGVVAVHALRGLAEASAGGSAEKALRAEPDEVAEWVILIETTDGGHLARLRETTFSNDALAAIGAHGTPARGIYRLQFGLDHADAAPAT
ncbi:DUF4286 family protein [Acuticoccus sp. MNP-M23]|uniref:DUF4286 family protein n=1 Tax=Acuticoccus sp. MNP-M23 TaxID=3072793 RepID=UPI002814EF3B|nr:DUF4286 family protein [Acuticoccus sp. MNP-M23]WMS40960.1 DUF4286 family protein [Acuticoccus sp. MNP-M23]